MKVNVGPFPDGIRADATQLYQRNSKMSVHAYDAHEILRAKRNGNKEISTVTL